MTAVDNDQVVAPTKDEQGRRRGRRSPSDTASTVVKVLRYAVQVAIAAVAVAAATLIVLPRAMGWQGVIVLTGSMEPALDTGGVAFVERIQPEDVRVGDIITFRRPDADAQVTHRVIEVVATPEGPRYLTKGDANEIPDEWVVRPSQLVGKVRLALPHLGGMAQAFVSNRHQLALFMAVPGAYLLADDVRRWRRRKRAAAEPVAEPEPAPVAPRPRRQRNRVTRAS